MYKFLTKLAAVLLSLAMVISLAACSNAPSTPAQTSDVSASGNSVKENVTLKVMVHYTSDDEKATWDYVMEKMKEVMPNVALEIDPTPQDSDAKLKTQFATGSLPDIFDLNLSNIPLGVKSNNLLPLDEYIEKYNIVEQLTPTGVALLEQQDGHTWSILSANTNFAVIYANKDLFDQAGVAIPENYQELLEAAQKLREKDILPLGIWLKEAWPAIQLYDMVSITENPKGVTGLDLNGTANTTDPEYMNAAQKISDMVNVGLISKDATTMDYNSAVAQFESGQCAMFLCGNWMAQEFGEVLGDNATILLPYIFADASDAQAVKNSGAMSGGGFSGGFAVSANSPHKEIAAEYAVQAALFAIEARIVKTGELNTMLKEAPASEKTENALTRQLTDLVSKAQTSTTMGWSFDSAKINTDLYSNLSSLYTGQYSPEDFANDTAKLITADRASE